MPAPREVYASRLAAVLTMVGVAVGLGNVWRFPYMMGANGGSAFLFVYLLFVVFFGLPAVMAEWALGRETGSGPIGAFSAAFGSRFGLALGLLLSTAVLVADSYYLVVIALVFYSAWFSAARGFGGEGAMEALNEGLGSGPIVGAIGVATLIAGLFVMAFGLQRGIVRSSKWCVPFFGVVVIYLIVNSFLLEGAPAKFAEFLRPDFAAMDMGNVFLALGQAFFSLSLGGTFFVIYGSYLKAEEDIPITAVWTSLGDAGAALLASLFIVPTILVFGLEMEKEGYMLTFNTLPRLFAQLPGGRLLGTFFLVAFALVAFLSNIAALQVFIGTVGERFDLRFRTLAPIVGAVEIALILFFAFNQNLIGAFDRALGSGMQCFGAAMALFALTWGLGRSTALRQIFRTTEGALPKLYFFWVKWVVPLGVLVALAGWILEEAKIFSAD